MTQFKLEPRTAALRFSLLASLGLLPFACSSTTPDTEPDGSSAGSGHQAGENGLAGANDSGAGGGAAVAGAGAGGRPVGGPPACTSPKLDEVSGLTTCAEGYHYRKAAVACSTRGGEPSDGQAGAGGQDGGGGAAGGAAPYSPTCSSPCTEPHSFCASISGTPAINACLIGCLTDDECGDDELCLCDSARGGGVCKPATCRGDEDCDAGYHCAQSEDCLYESGPFVCQKPEDECLTKDDCGGAMCWTFGTDHRVCNEGVACGRPFLVAAEARVASVIRGGAWASSQTAKPHVEHLTAAERAAQAAHWTRMGQMEHASIAAFARFSLQLLSLGAPPELVEACTAALADETAHTKLCFDIAAAYAGHAIGPGPLDIDGSLNVSSLEDIVDLVIAEGCFGETSAALEALEAADAAADPVIVAAYAKIAEDEQRHAELAFRFVKWALQRAPSAVIERVNAALVSSLAEQSPASAVVLPCLEGLLRVGTAKTSHGYVHAVDAICPTDSPDLS